MMYNGQLLMQVSYKVIMYIDQVLMQMSCTGYHVY